MRHIIQKKHSAIDLTAIAFSIIVIGIAVTIGAMILLQYRDARVTSLGTYAIVNETVGGGTGTTLVLNETNFGQLDNVWVKSIENAYNSSGVQKQADYELNSYENFTLTVNDFGVGSLTFGVDYDTDAGGISANNTVLNVSYTVYNTSEPEFSIPDKASLGLAEYGNWFKIMVIIAAAGLVFLLLSLMLQDRNRGGGGNVNF